ncbi:MAG: hypothetical protein ABIQ70_01205 [Dokdonella sp.]
MRISSSMADDEAIAGWIARGYHLRLGLVRVSILSGWVGQGMEPVPATSIIRSKGQAALSGLFFDQAQDAPTAFMAVRRCWEATQRRTTEWASCPFFVCVF